MLLNMRYQNSTSTILELVHGDIRDAPERFVVIGRDPRLKNLFEEKTGRPFSTMSWLHGAPATLSRANNRSLAVLRITNGPTGTTRHRLREIRRFQSAVEFPIAKAISWCDATEIAMVPISCRRPDVVAVCMIRIIWDISVAAFLHAYGPMKHTKPVLFRIYCHSGVEPFVEALQGREYADLDHGFLFIGELQCNRAKRARFVARRQFRFRPIIDGKLDIQPRSIQAAVRRNTV